MSFIDRILDSKYFKEAFGVSPSKYAKNYKNADNELL